jgi:DNA-binding LacI/PurR family transcriptional regulator
VARLARVDKATVSRALNNRPGVKESTRQRILKAAREVGYVAHPALASLVSFRGSQRAGAQGSTLVAVLTRFPAGSGEASRHLPAFQRAGQARGFSFSMIDTLPLPSAAALGRQLHSQGFSGVLLFRIVEDPGWFQDFPWGHFAVVSLDAGFQVAPVPIVRGSQFDTVIQGFDGIRVRGWKRIGPIVVSLERGRIENRRTLAAVRHCQEDLASEDRLPPYLFDPLDESSLDGVPEWIDKHRPDSLLLFNSRVGQYLVERHGVDLPSAVLTGANPSWAGLNAGDSIRQEALNYLDMLVRSAKYGLREVSVHSVVSSVWREGASLPRNGQAGDAEENLREK